MIRSLFLIFMLNISTVFAENTIIALVNNTPITFKSIDCWNIPVPDGWKNIKVAKFDDDT